MAKRWYIVHAYSNFEKKVADSIREKAAQTGLEHHFEDILVPTEKVVEVRRGRKVDSERKFFPGYVLVRMDLTDEAYHLIKNTPKVTGVPRRRQPADGDPGLRGPAHHGAGPGGCGAAEAVDQLEIGERIRVADGPFRVLRGQRRRVDEERARLKVAVSIFGRPTPVELGIRSGREGLSGVAQALWPERKVEGWVARAIGHWNGRTTAPKRRAWSRHETE
jgi:transcriptional antiterminator NusG